MERYYGVVYFKNGTSRQTGSCDNRQMAERMASQLFDQCMRTAVSDYFKPTRFEVITKK